MENRPANSLAQFCIDQRSAFDTRDWRRRLDMDGQAVVLVATYLSRTNWYGHERELGLIAERKYDRHDTGHELYRESQAIGFDLPRFSATVRNHIAQK